MQVPALGLAELHEVHADPLLKLVQVPLDGIPQEGPLQQPQPQAFSPVGRYREQRGTPKPLSTAGGCGCTPSPGAALGKGAARQVWTLESQTREITPLQTLIT